MNLQDYKNMSHDELAYLAFSREPKPLCRYDSEAYQLLKPYAFKPQEYFFAVSTDVQHHVVDFTVASIGQDDHVPVHARDIFRNAISANAHQIILAHNHPSGSPYWSDEDIRTTARLVTCGQILGIGIVDHILLFGDGYSSLASLCDVQKLGAATDFQGNLHSNDYTFKVLKAFDEATKEAQCS
jgi:DNA repair protein RadC